MLVGFVQPQLVVLLVTRDESVQVALGPLLQDIIDHTTVNPNGTCSIGNMVTIVPPLVHDGSPGCLSAGLAQFSVVDLDR